MWDTRGAANTAFSGALQSLFLPGLQQNPLFTPVIASGCTTYPVTHSEIVSVEKGLMSYI